MPLLSCRLALAPIAVLSGVLLLAAGSSLCSTTAVTASTSTNRTAAQALFREKGCEHCHGVDGVGGDKGPNLSGVGRTLKPEQIRAQILNGGDAMPAFNDVLVPSETDVLVRYLSSRKKSVKAHDVPGAPVKSPPSPDNGGSDDQ